MYSEVTDLSRLSAGSFSRGSGAELSDVSDTHQIPWLLLVLLGGLRSRVTLSHHTPGCCPFASVAAISRCPGVLLLSSQKELGAVWWTGRQQDRCHVCASLQLQCRVDAAQPLQETRLAVFGLAGSLDPLARGTALLPDSQRQSRPNYCFTSNCVYDF